MKHKVYVESSADRDTVVMILARNGYTVRHGKEKKGNRWFHFVEYGRDES